MTLTLEDWNALSPGDRTERSRRWISYLPVGCRPSPEEVEWQPLVMAAERRFSAQYGYLPDILHIGSSARFDHQNPVGIIVNTRLPAGQLLDELPPTFLSFPVIQESLGDEVEAFKRTWSAVLSRLFDWSDDAIRNAIAGMEWVYRSPFFMHERPCDNLQRIVLARSVVGPRAESELRKIGEELVIAIGGTFYVDQESDYDWERARESIATVILKYSSRV